jgi:excisionase family DNA binding protein
MVEIEPFVDAVRGAEFLGIKRRRLLELARAGTIPAHPIGNGKRKTWRFRLSELSEALTSQTRQK